MGIIPATGRNKRLILTLALCAAMPLPAWAVLACSASGGTGSSTSQGCDTTYRDLKVECKTFGTYPPCPAKPMPMKTTGSAPESIIMNYTPYLYAAARDSDDVTRPYSGELARGTIGDPTSTFSMVGSSAKNARTGATTKQQQNCIDQIDMPVTTSTSAADMAKITRLQLDNCTNQYILHSAMGPEYRKNTNQLSGENPSYPAERTSLKTSCQPLRTNYNGTPKPEYKVSDYLQVAWKKTMLDASAKAPRADVYAPDTNGMQAQYQLVVALPLAAFKAAVGAIIKNVPNIHEPSLPVGVKLKNTDSADVQMPSPFPDITLMQIASPQDTTNTNYEAINDPTHPFSPRWDFVYSDRDLSQFTSGYETDTKNSVYCAGNRANKGDSRLDKNIKVDVLEFRRGKFEKAMLDRIAFNQACYSDPVSVPLVPVTTPIWVSQFVPLQSLTYQALKANSYCYEITQKPVFMVTPGLATRLPCWQCFGHVPGEKVDDVAAKPPCATRYDSEDQKMVSRDYGGMPVKSAHLNRSQQVAHCTLGPDDKDTDGNDSVPSVQTICKDLRAPYMSMNLLKMRYHNKDDANNDELPNGVPEGYLFKDYFGDHMPYPRLWDTGRSIQVDNSTDQDPMDQNGQYTAVVGVGREALAKSQLASGTTQADQRCMLGGWGAPASFGGATIALLPDPVTSWTELKLYQTRTTRESNLVCLGRYEKVFQPRVNEVQLLMRSSAEFTTTMVCKPGADGLPSCRDYAETGTKPTTDESAQQMPSLWPLAWRGYMSDPVDAQRFPSFGGTVGKGVSTGLDNVQEHDLIMMPMGDSVGPLGKGLAKLSRVIGVYPKDYYVEVEEADDGKWPDVCGTTEVAGALQTRKLYKSGHYPDSFKKTLDGLKPAWTHGCEDPGLNDCELKQWDTLQFYHPPSKAGDDIRQGGTP